MWEEAVKKWLEENDRSQAWLARKADISETYFSKLLTGERNVSDEMLRRLETAMSLASGTLKRDGEPVGANKGEE